MDNNLKIRFAELKQCIASIKRDPELHAIEKSFLLKKHRAELGKIETQLREVR